MGTGLKIRVWLKKRGWLLPAILLVGLIGGVALFPPWVAARGPGSAASGPVPEIDADGPAEQGGLQLGDPTLAVPVAVSLVVTWSAIFMVILWRRNHVTLEQILSRGLAYLAVSLVLLGTYFASLSLLHVLFPVHVGGRVLVGVTMALIAAMALRPLQNWAERSVHRFFYGGWYDYPGLVEEVGQALARTLKPETLAEVLVYRVPRAMHLPGAALWLEREGKMEVTARSGIDVRGAPAWAWEGGTSEPGQMELTRRHAVVPLLVEGQVIGQWVLAARPAREWGPEDGRILAAIGRHAALAAQDVRLVTALRATVEEVSEMHRRLLAAREEERADLSRELHDGVIQDLIGLRYRLEAIEEGEGDASQVGEMHARVGALIDDLRRLCSDLRPSVLDQSGLAGALRALARESTARGLPVDVRLTDLRLPEEVTIGLYRVGQEALSNAWRHAKASRAVVTLAREGDAIVLAVADDGCGFDPAAAREQDGRFGLRGMSERAEALGGHLEIESALGVGTRVTVHCGVPGRQVTQADPLQERVRSKRRRIAREALQVSVMSHPFRSDL